MENIRKSRERQCCTIPVPVELLVWLRARTQRRGWWYISPGPREAKRVSRLAIRAIRYSVGNGNLVYFAAVCVIDMLAFKREIFHDGMEHACVHRRVPASDWSQNVSLGLGAKVDLFGRKFLADDGESTVKFKVSDSWCKVRILKDKVLETQEKLVGCVSCKWRNAFHVLKRTKDLRHETLGVIVLPQVIWEKAGLRESMQEP